MRLKIYSMTKKMGGGQFESDTLHSPLVKLYSYSHDEILNYMDSHMSVSACLFQGLY